MKYIKNTLLILAMALTTGLSAQTIDNGTMNSSKAYKYTLDLGEETIDYTVHVYENRDYNLNMDVKGKNLAGLDTEDEAAKTTKLIQVESDFDPSNNKFILITYDRQVTDTFKVSSIKDGFKVVVDGKEVEYVFEEGTYKVNTADNDFFVVQEFGR